MSLKDDEPTLDYDEYNPEALEKIISIHKTVIEYQKSKKRINCSVYLWLLTILQMIFSLVEAVNCYTLCSPGAGIHRFQP